MSGLMKIKSIISLKNPIYLATGEGGTRGTGGTQGLQHAREARKPLGRGSSRATPAVNTPAARQRCRPGPSPSARGPVPAPARPGRPQRALRRARPSGPPATPPPCLRELAATAEHGAPEDSPASAAGARCRPGSRRGGGRGGRRRRRGGSRRSEAAAGRVAMAALPQPRA